jgi:hypothetical protein
MLLSPRLRSGIREGRERETNLGMSGAHLVMAMMLNFNAGKDIAHSMRPHVPTRAVVEYSN